MEWPAEHLGLAFSLAMCMYPSCGCRRSTLFSLSSRNDVSREARSLHRVNLVLEMGNLPTPTVAKCCFACRFHQSSHCLNASSYRILLKLMRPKRRTGKLPHVTYVPGHVQFPGGDLTCERLACTFPAQGRRLSEGKIKASLTYFPVLGVFLPYS